ncbi:MAG: pyridoxamine 5'-phosphate oxidase family protein [Methylophilaceae bacterium]
MGKLYENISAELAAWISQQQMFFVATAPLSASGHVNVSPKGGEAFRVLGPLEAVYHDYTGSGVETAAHIQENGRIVIMFCAFVGPPKIIRLHGQGSLITSKHQRYSEFVNSFPVNPGTRSFVHVAITRVSDSCGFSVPFYEFQAPRDTLDKLALSKGPEKMKEYRLNRNQQSIDGLPAFNPNV